MDKPTITPPRRIVTGHNEQGRSFILHDGPAPTCLQPDHAPNVMMCDLWEIPTFPPDNTGSKDNSLRPVKLSPPTNGAIFRVVEFPPDGERNWAGSKQVFAQYGEPHALSTKEERHPGFHKTPSVDFAVCLQGEIWALMEEGETRMLPGDTLVQRGTNHAWANRGDKPARVAFIMIGAPEV
ncbi:cupin domain-containing protein [Variovorax paradoxus]|nr:cupin domain-containing protein [Variovorax paradoxus]MBT2305106.1 cupin domain-containing protein [Variovorax paradoxus]